MELGSRIVLGRGLGLRKVQTASCLLSSTHITAIKGADQSRRLLLGRNTPAHWRQKAPDRSRVSGHRPSNDARYAPLMSVSGTFQTYARPATSAFDPQQTWSAIASRGAHETRIYEAAMEGQNLAARLTAEIPTLTRHHQPLAFSLRC